MSALTVPVFNVLSECALLLLAHNAPVKIKNSQGWSPLAEAISYGDRQMSKWANGCFHVLKCDVELCNRRMQEKR